MCTVAPKKDIQKTIAFVILCTQKQKTEKLNLCLERINALEKDKSKFSHIYVYLIPTNKGSLFVRNKSYQEYIKTDLPNITASCVTTKALNTIEAKLLNHGIEAFLNGPADYVVFLHDVDVILDKNLLQYYTWLFDSAHNPDIIGAVTFSSNIAKKVKPHKSAKMWYADDTYIRGTCFKKEAIITTGPFDETFMYLAHEFDYSSRMVHHYGWLVRIGKEPNEFIKFTTVPLHENYQKLQSLKKQNLVWFARKWHNQGCWPKEYKGQELSNCYIKVTDKDFLKLFETDSDIRERTAKRLEFIYDDVPTKTAIKASDAFLKKPMGNFTKPGSVEAQALISDRQELQTYIECNMEYHKEMLWEPSYVY